MVAEDKENAVLVVEGSRDRVVLRAAGIRIKKW